VQACIREETLEKVQQGFARLVQWDDIKENLPPNLKISPVAAVPHKSRQFRTILDLSFQLQVAGLGLPSVNAATRKQAPTAAMRQLGKVLPQLIAAMAAAAPQHGPIFFAKLDITDEFWRMVVSKDNAWNFCYVLPGPALEPIQIIVPTSLEMGWCELPAFFCTATETVRNITQELIEQPITPLPEHLLEHLCLPHPDMLLPLSPADTHSLMHLLEVYVDDFIGLIQAPSFANL